MKIEAIFGGALALFVLFVAVYALLSSRVPGDGSKPPILGGDDKGIPVVDADSGLCQCFNEGFKLAGSDVGVMSSQYRTGFEQCRAVLGVDGGDAWTAGWNSRVSAKPYEASCRSWMKRQRSA
jgi:hypothetical protein